MKRLRTICVLALLMACSGVQGLGLNEVLRTSAEHFPAIQAAVQEKLIQQGRVTGALGTFDLALEQEGLLWADGFYDGGTLDSRLVKPLPWANARAYAGYRVSEADFPVYQQEYVTNSGGEFSLGVIFSLWRDRAIDARRAAIKNARLDVERAQIELELARLATQRNAARAYWQWSAAARRLAVYRELTTIAASRMDGLQQRAEAGDVAAIFVTENRQNLLRRQALLTRTEQAYTAAGIELSLYYRDDEGQPRLPPPGNDGIALPSPGAAVEDPRALATRIIQARPELARLDNQSELARQQLRLAENALKPRVDIGFKGSQDFGRGSRTREDFEALVDLSISIPLERRTGEGRRAEARARLNQIEWERALVEQQLTNDILKLATALNAAREFVQITDEESVQAAVLADAERNRFEAGASDFFLVNLREERDADARLRNIDARLRYHLARVDLNAITLDYEALGLAD